MPSIASLSFKINIPPSNGHIQVIPTEGISIKDVFMIKVLDMIDEDKPLSYKYHLYLTE